MEKNQRWGLTDAIKVYIDRHPELSDNHRRFLYSNASESLNLGLFAKRSKQLKELLGLAGNDLLRDSLSTKENATLASLEYLACQFVDHEDLDPCLAVKKAIETSYSYQMFAEKYLNGDALPPAKD
jgi:hypothetical protein